MAFCDVFPGLQRQRRAKAMRRRAGGSSKESQKKLALLPERVQYLRGQGREGREVCAMP